MGAETVKEQKEYIEKVKGINKDKLLKYYILTMGCQLNENDSEKLVGMVEEMGYTESKDLCTYQITLKGKNKTITKTIVMRLEEGTDFVMSFNVE